MNVLRLPLFLLIFLLPTLVVFAQTTTTPTTGSISGKLTDAQKNPLGYATVTLLRMDSSVVNGDLTKDDGTFSIKPTGTGNFRLRIEYMGLATKFMDVQITADAPDKKLGAIKMTETENNLKEVQVVGEKPIMELKVDKKVFNVEKNTTTAGGSAADVLQNVPSVSVDVDGNVSLRGKSDVTILIDGKPSTLLGTDVASALQSLPAGSIESVEVITNPSAKYDAQGSTGIINIVTKKDGRFGMNGNVTVGAGTHDKYNGNLGLNARKGKWTVFLNSSFRLNQSYNNVTTDRYNKDTLTGGQFQNFHTYENVPRTFDGYFNSIGASFDPDKHNSITLTQNINKMDFSFTDNSSYTVSNTPSYNTIVPNGNPILQENRFSSQGGGPFSTSTAIDYKHKFQKKDEELSFDATYAYNYRIIKQYYNTQIDTLVNGANAAVYNITDNAPGTSTNSSANIWADYTDPLFTTNGKLGLGFKSQFYWYNSTNNPVIDTALSNGTLLHPLPGITDQSLLAIYNYTQQIHAAYINWNDQLGKFSYQAGLRLEDNIYSGYGDVPTYATFQNNYLNLFPSAFVSYKLDDQESIYLNYSRRTNRPGFRQLLPFVDLSNPGTVNTGNPGLVPEFINNIEFSYSRADKKGNNFILSAYYSYTQNLIESITTPISEVDAEKYGVSSSELFSTPINIASGTTYGAEGTGHFQLLPIWDLTANVNLFENQLLIGNGNPLETQYLSNNSGFTWFGKINSNLKLPKSFSFQVNVNYTSPQVIAQGTMEQAWWMDAAIRKTLWKNKATIVVNCSDIFNTHHFITDYKLAAYNETINRVKETRVGNLTFTYRFGKSDFGKTKHMDDKPIVPTEQDRTKNLKQGGDDNDQGGDQGKGNGNGNGGKGGGTGGGAGNGTGSGAGH